MNSTAIVERPRFHSNTRTFCALASQSSKPNATAAQSVTFIAGNAPAPLYPMELLSTVPVETFQPSTQNNLVRRNHRDPLKQATRPQVGCQFCCGKYSAPVLLQPSMTAADPLG